MRTSILDTRVMRGTDVYSDHYLLRKRNVAEGRSHLLLIVDTKLKFSYKRIKIHIVNHINKISYINRINHVNSSHSRHKLQPRQLLTFEARAVRS